MDVFSLRDNVISDYAAYIRSFIKIKDPRIGQVVQDELEQGLLWPDPLIQINPAFKPGKSIDELVADGDLHTECKKIFCSGKSDADSVGKPIRLHQHQTEALEKARQGRNYILTTGTGSGKSLAYIIPIVDYVLRNPNQKGIKAIIVYPMNALANSQHGELEKFLKKGFPGGAGPVRFAKYTGQEDDETRNFIKAYPPDIILTNYVMLELIMTRASDRALIDAAQGLRFLVLDELHTYRGRQGADVAMLVRRVRDRLNAVDLQCVGTSATMASGESVADQKDVVSDVGTRLFGADVEPTDVIGETLRASTSDVDIQDEGVIASIGQRVQTVDDHPPQTFDDLVSDPLAAWIEQTFGIQRKDGRIERATPLSITGKKGGAQRLAGLTGLSEDACASAIRSMLMHGYRIPHPETGFPTFAFRLHQFISRGDTVFASPETPANRHITVRGQRFVPGHRDRILLPLAFCRECGQEYYSVRREIDPETGTIYYARNEIDDHSGDEQTEAGYVFLGTESGWPDEPEKQIELLPDDWIEIINGIPRLRRNRRDFVPRKISLTSGGQEAAGGIEAYYIPAPFRFCPSCSVAYGIRQRKDFAKLTTLGSEGRSTATTILSLTTIRGLREMDRLPPTARKLLSFTDNRQDASLQAGHFNDFIETSRLRAALYNALKGSGVGGISHDELALKVFDQMGFDFGEYAFDPLARYAKKDQTEQACRDVLAYRLYLDLRRGWRITSPNLEQCGLLVMRYSSLEELCSDEDVWEGLHPALANAGPERRRSICQVLLDYLRRELCIKVDYLDPRFQERIWQRSSQFLKAPWALDEDERAISASVAWPTSGGRQAYGGDTFVSSRGSFGNYIGRHSTLPDHPGRLSIAERDEVIDDLFSALQIAGLLEEVREAKGEGVAGYQIPAGSLQWNVGDGTTAPIDPLRTVEGPAEGSSTNPFFVSHYTALAETLRGLEAREHTAQVRYEDRIKREDRFRKAQLPILYCSPTMELGVDIAELNAVNMRNVPPTPANYAQRSGRAGRSGQPALVVTYCSGGSSHDQYFFRRPDRMVAGSVTPPRLDLANEDLIRAHMHSVWLAETGVEFGTNMTDVLVVEGDRPTLALKEDIQTTLENPAYERAAQVRCERILGSLSDDLAGSDWFGPEWLGAVMRAVPLSLDSSCDRWRTLYLSALEQARRQQEIILDASRSRREKDQADRLRREAEQQLRLLTDVSSSTHSDFYTYRYFASEGFLPGYNFPRLPLSAYIPARRAKGDEEFVSRPRFLAISEFGPRAFIYHEGSRFIINKVILPVGQDQEAGRFTTIRAKRCESCGYFHPMPGEETGADVCEHCNALLGFPISSLFVLQNVATKRRDRISSDEEERMRLGYELVTGIRFATRRDQQGIDIATATANSDKGDLVKLTYGSAATVSRVNLGWRNRENKSQLGFVLDVERGYWASNKKMAEADPEDPLSPQLARVVPYVEDTRNSLILEPGPSLSVEQLASLMAALKNAIQVLYQLEPAELAAELLPDRDTPRTILLYEAAEGGAGVLRRLLDDAAALPAVAREALRICHFDPDSGEDLRHAPGAIEDCEAACYDCLMHYGNQRDHELLDRKLIRDLLLDLATSRVDSSPTSVSKEDHLDMLNRLAGSELERKWLRFLRDNGLRLPSGAQALMDGCKTRPDFTYAKENAVVYVDGPPHDYADRQDRDGDQQNCLEDLGYLVIRFHHEADWDVTVKRYPSVFGSTS